MVEHRQPFVLRAKRSADVVASFGSGEATLHVARVVDEDKRYALFLLSGHLDEGTAPLLLEHLVAAARIPDVDLVIVDLLRVGWLGAPGTLALEAAWRAAGRHGAEFVVCRPSGFVSRVLDATGLAGLIADDPDGTMMPSEDAWRWD